MNKKEILEGRPTDIVGLLLEIKRMPSIEKLISSRALVDGMSALFRTKDGNAYEFEIRQAKYKK